ncbi:type I polyketide synthase [Sciscionella marina]|uniref:type I polyketide synthase n=1 Tax=Sciscionella marina TaxID=508770 RepID=UPI0003604207|nr:type I polyketide synthase [Sciscionella marina]
MANEDKLRDYLKLVTADLQKTRQQARELSERANEPIAIVGMGCRFPGGISGPEQFWSLVGDGVDAISGFPADRGWDVDNLYDAETPSFSTTHQGGFLYDAPEFDAGFFGISPREALAMDPQQRLLLEISWETLERAGIVASSLRGTRTGVFAGVYSSGYGTSLRIGTEDVGGHLLTGTANSVLSGRVAFTLGLEGPAVSVDTACSSSLVSLHLAAQALRSGECSLALAGGVTVMSTPTLFAEFARQQGLAGDGRCKSFSAEADGTGWGEGAGMLVLERLSDARRNGRRILAVIRGSAVNQDGASNGLTAPNGPAQRRVIESALAAARVPAAEVDAVEAHGTGTTLGDPIEATALLATYGQNRPDDRPLWLGSVKSNFGHTQAAAGVAGVIKMVMALRNGMLPRTLHAAEPSPHVEWSPGTVRLLTEPVPWEAGERPRRAGISGFGISGTNAHLVLEEAPEPVAEENEQDVAAAGSRLPVLTGATAWLLSSPSGKGLAAQASRLREHVLAHPELDNADVAWSLATTRSEFEHRAVVTGEDPVAGLAAAAAEQPAGEVVTGEVLAGGVGRTVFVFPGQGCQWLGMGRELAESSPVFAARLAECAAALAPVVDWSLDEVLAGAHGFESADVVQPALWAVLVSLAEVWRQAGVRPDAVVGHSQGEIAAAVVAGILSLEDAARVVALRSKALTALAGRGGMMSVAEPASVVRDRIAACGDRLALAAANGPQSTVVSGDPGALHELAESCPEVRTRIIPVDYASHSAHVDDLCEEILGLLAGISPHAAEIPMISAMTGEMLEGSELDAGYWYASLRNTVEFDRAIRTLGASGHRVFLETSPHPVLTTAIADNLEDDSPVVTGTLRRDDGGAQRLLLSFAEAHVNGVTVDWTAVLDQRDPVDLPTYAFQRQRYWPQPAQAPALAEDTAESVFWNAVESGDVRGLADTLAVDDQSLGEVLPALASWHRRERHDAAAGQWRYRVTWTPAGADRTPVLAGTWLVVTGAAVPDDCLRALTGHGAEVRVLRTDDTDRQRIAAELPRDELAGVLSLLALDEESVAENSVVPRGIAATLGLVQALGDAGIGAPLWVATRGAVAATAADEPANPVQAQAWGLGRVVGLEHPDRWGGLIDLPGTWDEPTARRLCGVLAGGAEDQVAVRPAGTLARRLERDRQRRADTAPWSPRGTVLVTGGTGSIGAHIGPWLAEHGARRVVLPSRSGPSAALASSAAALVGQGTAVDVVACDIAERDQMAGLLDRIAASGPALSTVIHAANVFHLTRIEETDIDGLATALAAKVAGAVWLDELTGNLDEFVLFSSIAATWGSNEHGVYAAANAHLDALAECRRARGLPATSIAWGVWDTRDWDALNAATAHEPGSVTPARLLRQGMRFLPPEPALAAMGRVLAEGDTFLVLADMDWARFAPVYTAARSRALLERIPEARQNTGPAPETTPAANGELARGLTEATAAERSRIVTELVRTHAAATLGHDSAREVPGAKAFRELGFDSLTAVELRKRLNAATGLKLPSSIVFDYPNPAALAERILGQLLGTGAAEQPAAPAAVTADPGEPLAIIGMGCRFPGGAASPEQYWDLLTAGADVIAEFPTDRGWDADLFDPDPDKQGKSYTRFGGFLYDAAEFDPRFFGISPREALAMDPQQRLLLEVSWEALERAGIDPESLRGTPAGVFAGAALTGYGAGMAEGDSGAEGYLVTGNSGSVISGRVAYTLGLEGPAVTIDTACSSSLVALNTAGQALRTGECSLALVGGVMVMAAPGQFIGFSRQRGLSVDGRCKAFSAEADGMGMSEGAGMLAVERLSDARRLGHPVLAVIRGTAMNQDGASNGLTAPNGPAQQRVIRAALADAGLRSSDVDAVEAHGTGTVLGDPIEAGALIATYGQERDQPLWLGSVKSNIGHTQTAAGVAGLIKMVLALQHKTLPRTLHAGEPSLHIDWDSGQVRLLTEELPWISDGASRRAGVSAFGMSGTNVHVILEEAPDEPAAEVTGRDLPVLATEARAWPVSGRTGEGLAAQAGRLREYVLARPELDPADLAWSLATTRASFGHRAVVLGAHREELAAGLAAVATGQPDPGVITGGAAAGDRERVAFVFPGQGSQWLGMGRRMLAESPLFAARFAECGCALSSFVDWDLTDVVNGVDGAPGLDSADVMQPVLWAIMVSLAEVWRAAGVRPDAVLGHSQGEIAAACVAGVLSVEDAARVVALRSKALSVLDVEGGMLSVVMPAEQVSDILEPWGERLSVAAVNSPTATVVSGSPEALTEFERELRSRRVMRWRIPATDFVAHSVLVEPLAETLPGELAGIQPAEGEIPFFSTVESRWLDGTELDADYWYANVRKPVRFAESVLSLAESGYEAFIEVSAHPVLTTAVEEVFDAREDLPEPMVVGTLHREDGGAERILRALGEGHVRGVDIDWAAVLGGGHRVELPTYAFQHQHYWPQPKTTATVPGQDSGSRTAEARFWAAVEEGDLHTLADTLAIEDRTRLEGVLPALASWRRRERGDSAAENWRFRVAWAPVAAPTTAVLSGTWLAVSSAELPEHPAARTLAEHGAEVITIAVDTVDRAALAGRLAGLRPDGVVSLLALDESTMDGYPAVPTGLAGTLALVQALGDAGIDAPLWALTRGAVATGSGEVVADPRQAQVWGLGRTVAAEHPDRWGGLIDLPEAWDERAAGRFCAVLAERDEDQVALRGNGILARRLARAPLPATSATHYRPRGTVLITGGTGAIGGHVGRWLTAREARRVVLTSRSGPQADGVAGLAADLAGAGADVDILTCDTGERGEIAGVLDRIAATGPALSTVMHAAGALDDGVLDRLNPERLSSTLSGKAAGAVWLDELTADLDLDAFVLFSSTSATFGNGGQGNYAAANCFLDALAEDRRARGLAGLSLAWGPWDGGGVGQASEGARQRLARNKWEVLMDPELAVRAMGQAIEDPDSVVLTLMEVDFDALATERGAEDLRNTPFLRDLPELRTAGAATPAQTGVDTDGALYTRLSGLPETEQQRVLVDLIRAEAAMVMGYDSAEVIEQTRAFSEMGLDSLTSVELRNRLNTATGLHLPTTLLFDHPDPVALAAFLRAELLGADPVPADIPGVRVTEDEPLAIVAMGCRFPGGVRSPEELWELLATGGDAISGLPTDRGWDLDTLYDPDPDRTGTLYVREGGFLHDAPEFDAGFFGISPREALAMDPQQRLLLEVSWEALERGGIDLGSLRGSRTGVFIGGYFSGYDQFTSQAAGGGLEGHLMTGNATSVLSGRVSYLLGLEGPALTVDTACSSSLVALHMACQALRNDECSLALVGGVTVMATPRDLVGFSRQRGLSVDGRCKAFSASADGMGMAEGAGMLAVERLSDARHNGRRILAVIRGSAVNQDGASNGLTAPNGPSQQRVIRAALADAGLSASDVDAVEAHGTGTTLGDPIEAQALLATYGQGREQPVWLGSVKSNIGHAQAAAGVAGVIKMVLALRHGELPRTLHADEPSPHVDWSAGAMRLLSEPVPWQAGDRTRRAGVSGFGMSGTNAHVILEEAPAPVPAESTATAPVLSPGVTAWPVSARTAAALAAQAGRLREFVLARPEVPDGDVAWSLASTRSVFEHRAVVLGDARDELAAGLAAVATGADALTGVAAPGAIGRRVFVFPGQGSQWLGMGRELAGVSPVFAARLAECAGALSPFMDWSLDDVVSGVYGFESADVVQPALWAVMVSLAEVWKAAGVVPDVVVGHSQGEIAAAVVAGVLSLDDGARVVSLRSKALATLAGQGGMMSIAEPADVVRERIQSWGVRLSVAAVNGPQATVVSGDPGALEELADSCPEVRTRMIPVDYASHSGQVDALREEIFSVLDGISPQQGDVPMVSAMTGEMLSGPELDAEYWFASLREPVEFERAIRTLGESGHGVFVEASPHPVLTTAVTDTLEDADPIVVGTLRRDDGGADRLLASFGEAFVRGVAVDWTTILGSGTTVDLPTYAFQHERYWVQPGGTATGGSSAESAFWAAVEHGDPSELAATLAVNDECIGDLLPALISWRRNEREESAVADWRYRITWNPVTESGTTTLTGTWLVLGRSTEVTRALTERGAHVVTADRVDRAELAQFDRLAGVVSLLALDETPTDDGPTMTAGLAATLDLVHALGDTEIDAPLWVLTRGAVATAPGEAASPAQAQAWGLGRVVGLEHPERWGGLADLPENWDERIASRLCAVLAGTGEDQVALRQRGILARRLTRAAQPRRTRTWTPRGSVLVTGGTGAIGGQVGRWAAGRGAERVVLAASNQLTAEAASVASDTAAAGSEVLILACDTTRRAELAGLLDRIAAEGPALTAVVHAAGAGQATSVADTSTAELAEVSAAKAAAAIWLDELIGELDAFVVFSSIAATWGSALVPGYAAGNAALDALVERRRAHGRVATSIAWGPWADGTDPVSSVRHGLRELDPAMAVRALAQVLDGGEDLVTIADVDWATFAPAFTLRRPSPLFESLAEVAEALTEPEPADSGDGPALVERLAGLPPAQRDRELTELVRTEAARVLDHTGSAAISPDRAFSEIGFDSLTSLELRNRLSAATGVKLPSTVVFEFPTPAALAAHLLRIVTGDGAEPERVLTEVDRLESMLIGMPVDQAEDDGAARITARLEAVLARWKEIRERADGPDVSGRLESADDDEVFEFIGKEFGIY